MDIYEEFKNFIKGQELLVKNDRLLLGVSGGPDSLTMLDLFHRLSLKLEIELFVFHLNHMFRKEAASEADFVRDLCYDYDIDCFIEKFDVPSYAEKHSLSSEQAARKIRMELLFERAQKLNLKKIALAHNKDDLVETVFLNMFRGCSLPGLTGIEAFSEIDNYEIIHPLLSISRNEIENYCIMKNLNPRRDKSNEKNIYTRNKIRNDIIPYIEKEINPSLKNVVARMASTLKEENDFLKKLSREKYEYILIKEGKNRTVLSLEKLMNLSEVLKRRILFYAIYSLKEKKADIYFKHYKEISKLFNQSTSSKTIDLPGDITIKREYEKLIIQKGKIDDIVNDYLFEVNIPGLTKLPFEMSINTRILEKYEGWQEDASKNNIALIDIEKVALPLKIRNRKNGDKFKPLGMNGYKKIKDFFIDEKVIQQRRDKIPLVIDNNGVIVWVAGFRIDDRIKIDNKTKKIIEITLLSEGEKYE